MATTLQLREFVGENFSIEEDDLANNVPYGEHVLQAIREKHPDYVLVELTTFDHDAVATFWSRHNHFWVLPWRWWDEKLETDPIRDEALDGPRHKVVVATKIRVKFRVDMKELHLSQIKDNPRLEGRLEHLQKICRHVDVHIKYLAEEKEFRETREDKLTPALSDVLDCMSRPLIGIIVDYVREPLSSFPTELNWFSCTNCNMCGGALLFDKIEALLVKLYFDKGVRTLSYRSGRKSELLRLGISLHKPCDVVECKDCAFSKARKLTYVGTFPAAGGEYFYVEGKDAWRLFCIATNHHIRESLLAEGPVCQSKRVMMIQNGKDHYTSPVCESCLSWDRRCCICGDTTSEVLRFDAEDLTFCTGQTKCYRFYGYTEAKLPKPTERMRLHCPVCPYFPGKEMRGWS
jgi:hypothetical protein